MATVTQILDRASRITGLRATGTERDLALEALNDTYLDVCMQVGMENKVYRHTFQTPPNDEITVERHEELDFSSLTPPYPKLRDDDIQLPPTFGLLSVVHEGGQNAHYPLRQVSDSELLEHRRGNLITGYPRIYSMAGTGLMRIWPRPTTGDTLAITYIPMPRELTEGTDRPPAFFDEAVFDLSVFDDDRGAESTPSQVPVQFHWSVLLPGTVVQMLDKDQRLDEVSFWQNRYEAGIAKMHMWLNHFGGTPTPVLNATDIVIHKFPDQRSRYS